MQLIENASAQKLRGAYYTPPAIAHFLLRWGIGDGIAGDILEPSCGDGVFLRQLAEDGYAFRSVVAVELDKAEAEKSKAVGLRKAKVLCADFHRFCLDTDKRFDLVVGNPPFIRYQYYPQSQQIMADEIFKDAGLRRSKLTNAWVTFVVGSSLLLRERGKLGFVVPSELLQVSYARPLRQFLARFFNRIGIVSFANLVFKDIQQDVVLLLCEKDGSKEHFIEHVEVKDADALAALDHSQLAKPSKRIDFHSDKWNYYFLDKGEIDFLHQMRGANMPSIGNFADVEVGITTGSNEYFTVPQSVVDLYQMQTYARPMVGRSVQVNSIRFTIDDWKRNRDLEARTNLLVFPPKVATEGGPGVRTYLENGEKIGINKGYKTRIREDWYVIPSIRLSDALFLRRNNLYPKFVLNEAKAYTTDTMHRVFIHVGVNREALIASYYNSLSFAFAEIVGRNFGGGVLELMPSEVEEIYMPYREGNATLFPLLDGMARAKRPVDEILDLSDDIILRQGIGLNKDEIEMARSIWRKLSGRRLNRQSPNGLGIGKSGDFKYSMPDPEQMLFAMERKRRGYSIKGTGKKKPLEPSHRKRLP